MRESSNGRNKKAINPLSPLGVRGEREEGGVVGNERLLERRKGGEVEDSNFELNEMRWEEEFRF